MEKAEIFSFPTVIGSGGRGQSLHNEVLIGAKPFKLSLPYDTFLLTFGKRFVIFVPRSLYHTYRRLYANTTSHHKKRTPKPWPTRWKPRETKGSLPSPLSSASPQLYICLTKGKTMTDAMEIASNEGIPALPPLPRVAPVLHAPGKVDGQNWPSASAGIAVAAVVTPQPQ